MNQIASINTTYMLDETDRKLITCIQAGLPLSPQPYMDVADKIGLSELEVLQRLQGLLDAGVLRRLGVVVRHRELGYRANAMVVWDIPDSLVDEMGCRLRRFESVTLCYKRPRHLPDWPYNLFCMIHGHDRDTVLASVQQMIDLYGLQDIRHEVLFSRRRFKQCGANYSQQETASMNKIAVGSH